MRAWREKMRLNFAGFAGNARRESLQSARTCELATDSESIATIPAHKIDAPRRTCADDTHTCPRAGLGGRGRARHSALDSYYNNPPDYFFCSIAPSTDGACGACMPVLQGFYGHP